MSGSLRVQTALFLIALTLFSLSGGVGTAAAQEYDKSAPAFPNIFAPYEAREVPKTSFVNSMRLSQSMRDGKLMLSLDDALALALENNLDLVIARYNRPIADTDILRTKSGANVRGVNTGIVQGTPGGGVGSIGNTGAAGGGAGGTSAAAGGAATGTGGLVSSTLGVGPVVDSFDPAFSSTLGVQHANTPQANTIVAGVPSLLQNTSTGNFGYQQGFPTGTLFNVTFNNSRVTSNSVRTTLVPQLNSNFLLQFRQHLLQGLGPQSNRRFMIIAKNNREIVDVAFRQQVIFTATQIQNLYWNLVSAYEDVQAKQRTVGLAQQLETNNRRQVEVGTLAAIEVVNAQAQVATANQALIASQINLQLQQVLMKNAITRNENDAVLASAPVIPTDRMQLPAVEQAVPTQDLVNEALQRRTEIITSRIDLSNRQVSKTAARNALRPTVDLVANYGGTGLSGVTNPFFVVTGTTAPPTQQNGGYWDAVSGLGSSPTYFVGLNVTIPILNRSAQADQVRSELEFRQAEVRLQQIQNTIAIDVRNAQYAVQANRAQVDAAQKARDYATQNLDAEQKKLAQGITTTYNVTQTLSNLATAESNLVSAMTAYEQSRVQLDVVTGRTLDSLGIDLGDAETGVVTKMPHVDNVIPAPAQPTTPAAGQAGAPQQNP